MSLTASQHRHTYLAYTHHSLQILESPCCLLSFPKARLYLEEYTFRTNSQCSYNQLFDRVWSSLFMILILPSDVFFLQLNFHLRILCIILKCFYHIQPVNTILAVSQKNKKRLCPYKFAKMAIPQHLSPSQLSPIASPCLHIQILFSFFI